MTPKETPREIPTMRPVEGGIEDWSAGAVGAGELVEDVAAGAVDVGVELGESDEDEEVEEVDVVEDDGVDVVRVVDAADVELAAKPIVVIAEGVPTLSIRHWH
jgi:hypothetical protein